MPARHPLDDATERAAMSAKEFIASLYHDHLFIKRPAASLAEARKHCTDLVAEYAPSRRPVVYAIAPDGSQTVVPNNFEPQARPDAARTFGKRFNAQRAARCFLRNKNAREGVDFTTQKNERGKWHYIIASTSPAAPTGLPPPPDFSFPSKARYRKKLDALVALANAGDVRGLKAAQINPCDTSTRQLARYRDLVVEALSRRR